MPIPPGPTKFDEPKTWSIASKWKLTAWWHNRATSVARGRVFSPFSAVRLRNAADSTAKSINSVSHLKGCAINLSNLMAAPQNGPHNDRHSSLPWATTDAARNIARQQLPASRADSSIGCSEAPTAAAYSQLHRGQWAEHSVLFA